MPEILIHLFGFPLEVWDTIEQQMIKREVIRAFVSGKDVLSCYRLAVARVFVTLLFLWCLTSSGEQYGRTTVIEGVM